MSINIYDTARRAKLPFEPMEPGRVSIYVCGLTVYDLPHIGHARTFVVFDVIRRFLEQQGWRVQFIRNHTDVDDKIIRRANEIGEPPTQLADRMIQGLTDDMTALDVRQADVEPRVTEHIEDIVELVRKLVEKGFGYVVDGDVYFRVRAFEPYGKFSGRNLDDLASGHRVDVNERKEDPLDFALWKASKSADEPAWESPWGPGRPGWHIECSAMSTRYLSNTFDIHGGGRDLIFPHHENEIAQSVAALGGEFARHWMHVGMVEIEGEKMSHSLDNFWTVRDILQQVHAEALRYFFLTTHYRNNINFSRDAIAEATRRVTYLYRTLETIDEGIERFVPRADPAATRDLRLDDGPFERRDEIEAIFPAFVAAMSDDFAAPRALAALADAARLANEIAEQKGKMTPERARALLALRKQIIAMGEALGLFSREVTVALGELTALELQRRELDPLAIDTLVAQRSSARSARDWSEADRIRDLLVEMGVQVLDKPTGTFWRLT